jgi:hypothetical protein
MNWRRFIFGTPIEVRRLVWFWTSKFRAMQRIASRALAFIAASGDVGGKGEHECNRHRLPVSA